MHIQINAMMHSKLVLCSIKNIITIITQRHLLLGINPGRFGGGVTGIPFTDPIRLQNVCGIENNFEKKQELSSVFIYAND